MMACCSASSMTMTSASASLSGGVITRRCSSPTAAAVQPRNHPTPLLTRVPKIRRHVVTRASQDDDDAPNAAPQPTPPGGGGDGASSLFSRRNLIDGALIGLSIPLWKDIAHDLGYLHGMGVVQVQCSHGFCLLLRHLLFSLSPRPPSPVTCVNHHIDIL